MKIQRRSLMAFLTSGFFLFCSDPAFAQTKLRVGLAGLSNEYIAFYVGKEMGRFKEQGLDTEIITFSGGSPMLQAMLAGELNLIVVGGTFVQATLRGADLVAVATPLDTFPYGLVVKSSIGKPDQLKGTKLGISRFGTASELGLRAALHKVGVDPETSKITIMQVGDQASRFAALQSGAIDGTVLVPPSTWVAEKLGFKILLDMAPLTLPFPQQNVVTRRNFIERSPEVVEAFLKGSVAAIRDAKIEKEKTVNVLAKYLRLDIAKDRDLLEAAQRDLAVKQIRQKPYPALEAIRVVLGQYSKEPKDPKEFVDERFMRKLDESGFIDALYR
jgi:NitT/TauT family transport system substrate-binding protein